MRPIRIAAQLHPQQGDYPALRDAAIRAEELGYDVVYNWDHFCPLYGDRDGPSLECWTVLAAWAEATRRIEIAVGQGAKPGTGGVLLGMKVSDRVAEMRSLPIGVDTCRKPSARNLRA